MALLLLFLFISLGINILLFFPAYWLRTDKLTDMSYSLTFVVLVLAALLLSGVSFPAVLLASMVFVWAIRLGVFLVVRIRRMKRDKRFDGMRESFFSFLKFWVLQGFSVWVILLPSLFFLLSSGDDVFWFGFVIWLFGLVVESVADFQKYSFKQDARNEGRFIRSGLWKYSRHPNYFGEMLCWMGIYVLVFPSLGLPQRLIGLISPLFISSLLLFVTGIPPLEKYADEKWGKNREYKEYKRRTSLLVLWPLKK